LSQTDSNKTRYLASGPSFVLDLVRILAALAVAVGHLSQPMFTTGWPPSLMSFAVGAVAVFFVLSGFVIRCITVARRMDARRYAADRFARIYSVVLPAMALTILFDAISSHASPAWYQASFGSVIPPAGPRATLMHVLASHSWLRDSIRILLNLTMLSQSWFQDVSPLSNSPFWSLSYECVYYALFGITLYLRGSKKVLAWILVFLLIGPTVFLMFPLWLLGCAAWDAYQNGFEPRSIGKLIGCSLLSIAGVHGSHAVVERFHLNWFRLGRVIVPMDFIAIGTVAVLLPLCIALRNLPISERGLPARMVRRLGDATFPLYLIHFPLFVLLAATLPYPRAALWVKLVSLGAALLISIAFSIPTDRLKFYLRSMMLPMLPGTSRNAPVSTSGQTKTISQATVSQTPE
jgi:peptidoglycan/LPS O-acetylase OafA/YrhL